MKNSEIIIIGSENNLLISSCENGIKHKIISNVCVEKLKKHYLFIIYNNFHLENEVLQKIHYDSFIENKIENIKGNFFHLAKVDKTEVIYSEYFLSYTNVPNKILKNIKGVLFSSIEVPKMVHKFSAGLKVEKYNTLIIHTISEGLLKFVIKNNQMSECSKINLPEENNSNIIAGAIEFNIEKQDRPANLYLVAPENVLNKIHNVPKKINNIVKLTPKKASILLEIKDIFDEKLPTEVLFLNNALKQNKTQFAEIKDKKIKHHRSLAFLLILLIAMTAFQLFDIKEILKKNNLIQKQNAIIQSEINYDEYLYDQNSKISEIINLYKELTFQSGNSVLIALEGLLFDNMVDWKIDKTQSRNNVETLIEFEINNTNIKSLEN